MGVRDEYTAKSDAAAHAMRRTLIDAGADVSLVAFDVARDAFVFDTARTMYRCPKGHTFAHPVLASRSGGAELACPWCMAGARYLGAFTACSGPCCHPMSCLRCQAAGEACGSHSVGDRGHERCTGSAKAAL
jgi:hypothetical protein